MWFFTKLSDDVYNKLSGEYKEDITIHNVIVGILIVLWIGLVILTTYYLVEHEYGVMVNYGFWILIFTMPIVYAAIGMLIRSTSRDWLDFYTNNKISGNFVDTDDKVRFYSFTDAVNSGERLD